MVLLHKIWAVSLWSSSQLQSSRWSHDPLIRFYLALLPALPCVRCSFRCVIWPSARHTESPAVHSLKAWVALVHSPSITFYLDLFHDISSEFRRWKWLKALKNRQIQVLIHTVCYPSWCQRKCMSYFPSPQGFICCLIQKRVCCVSFCYDDSDSLLPNHSFGAKRVRWSCRASIDSINTYNHFSSCRLVQLLCQTVTYVLCCF